MLNVVIDLSHHNTIDLKQAQDAGILAIIHKATQGTQFSDGKFRERMSVAQSIGMRRGAYHFLDNTDGAAQAEHFLATVADFSDALLAVDVENEPSGPSATLQQLYNFVLYVYTRTNRWPGIYGGSYLRQLLNPMTDNSFSVLTNCWLWVSDYRKNPAPELPTAWTTWKLWQYTDSKAGNPPHDLAGVCECDRDLFNGTNDVGEFEAFWDGR